MLTTFAILFVVTGCGNLSKLGTIDIFSLSQYDRTGWEFVRASSATADNPGRYIIDNDLETFWHSTTSFMPTLPHWLIVDMKTSQSVFKFDIYRRVNWEDTRAVELYLSDSPDPNGSWTKIGEGAFPSGAAGRKESLLSVFTTDNVTKGRYFKLMFPNGRPDSAIPYVSITEVYLYYR